MKINRSGRLAMATRTQMKTNLLAASVALALVQMASVAYADSGVGQDTTMGNALNRQPINPTTYGGLPDHDNIGAGYDNLDHTPSGQFYDRPLVPNPPGGKTAGGWEYTGHIEGGIVGTFGNDKSHGFRRYKDVDDGLYLNNFGVNMEKKDTASFFEISGGGVGQDDQFYSAQFGRYNDWKVSAFYNETPHVFTSTFRNIYNGVGTGNLTLKAGLTAGGAGGTNAADAANVAAVANANADTEIGLIRKKGGARLDMYLDDRWKLYASYTNEKRQGARPFGSVWGGGGGTAPTETLEPIDYRTHDLLAGLEYADDLNAFNLRFQASWFRNEIDTLTFQTPYRIAAAATNGVPIGGFTQGRFDLYPDNNYYNIKGEYSRRLPDFYKGKFTASVAFASSRQDDDLIPYTTLSTVNLANVTGDNWNSVNSLSKDSAETRIDTKLINLGLALNPTNNLNLSGKLRYYETKNFNDYLACNRNASYVDNDPNTGGNQAGGVNALGCNGVWGRLINEGSGSAVLMGATSAYAGNLNIASVPFDYKQLIYGFSGDYRLNRTNSLNFAYEREKFDRDHREREKTWEDKVKLGYVNRGIEDATLRMSFENDRRRGSEYHTHHPYAAYYSGDIVTMPTAPASNVQTWVVHMNSGMRKFDLSDRDQNILNGRVNFMLRPDLDFGIMGQLKDIRYPDSMFGRTDKQSQHSINFDLSYQPDIERSIYGFYSYQVANLKQKGNQSGAIAAGALSPATAVLGCTIGTVTPMGTITADNAEEICQSSYSGSVWLLANGWAVNHKDTTNVLGFGWKEVFGTKTFDFNYTYAGGKTKIGYDPAGGTTLTAAALAGDGMPDLKTVAHIFEANLLVPIDKNLTSRIFVRHEIGRIDDWHYTGLQNTPVAINNAAATNLPTATVLDAGPQDYRASVLGVLFNYKM